MNIIKKCLGILYPQTCCFCGKVNCRPICEDCRGKVKYVQEPVCKKCGKPVRYDEQEYCKDCLSKEMHYEQGKSIWLHKGLVMQSVYRFKYANRRIYAEFYAEEMARIYGGLIKAWGIDVIIPIPLHRRRRRKRGYNQAEILARELGKRIGIPVEVNALLRKKYTRPQKELDDKERLRNLRGAFGVSAKWSAKKNVLLIDDIYTTGNTINEAAGVLKANGVQKIWFLTISIGQGF